jgi:hypothetical protein
MGIFTFWSLFYMPQAYYYIVKNKWKLADWSRERNNYQLPVNVYRMHWFIFLFFGPIKMTLRLLYDEVLFFWHLFGSVKEDDIQDNEDKIDYLNLKQFELIEDIVDELAGGDSEVVQFKDIIK